MKWLVVERLYVGRCFESEIFDLVSILVGLVGILVGMLIND